MPLKGTVAASLSPQRQAKIRKLEETLLNLQRDLNTFECLKCREAYPEQAQQQGIACPVCEWKCCQWCIDMCEGRCPYCEFKKSSHDSSQDDDDDDDSGTEDY